MNEQLRTAVLGQTGAQAIPLFKCIIEEILGCVALYIAART